MVVVVEVVGATVTGSGAGVVIGTGASVGDVGCTGSGNVWADSGLAGAPGCGADGEGGGLLLKPGGPMNISRLNR